MRKIISSLLAVLMIASVLTACSPGLDQLDPAITVASSDAQANAEWLDERLGNMPGKVVVGLGSNETYGIDMSNFEDDGYIARVVDGEAFLFGVTTDGLDRAVRAYAKAVEEGTYNDLDTVYHEGARIKNLTVDGRDISEYTITYVDNGKEPTFPIRDGMTQGNAKFAASELARLLEVATGIAFTPVAYTDTMTGPMIKIGYIEDGTMGTNGFEYWLEDGNIYINGVTLAHGCAHGVYYFLEHEIGWEGLTYGDSELIAADHVNVSPDAAASVDPLFDYFLQHQIGRFPYNNERSANVKSFLGYMNNANHGMQTKEWSGNSSTQVFYYQICHTDENNYNTTFDKVLTYVKNQVAAGNDIGEEFSTIDISQGDNLNYCNCSACIKLFRTENRAHAGAVVRFANRLAEDMEAEGLYGLYYQIFAYHGSNKPCITAPRSDVFITFCSDGACIQHPLDGTECYGESFDMAGAVQDMESLNNSDYAEWIKGWDAMTEDNLMIWHYALDNSFGQYTYLKNFYDDIMFLRDNGVKGLYFQSGNYGLGVARIRASMLGILQFHPDMTKAEYEIALERVMERQYGEGWDYVRDFIGIWETIENRYVCWNCWGYSDQFNIANYDTQLYSEKADQMYGLLEQARFLADTEAQELSVQRLMLEVAYRQCLTTYFTAYDAGDTETMTHLEERYAKFVEYSLNNGYDLNVFVGGYGGKWDIEPVLEDEAWMHWLELRADLTPEAEGAETKPLPDKWVQWYETYVETTETAA